MSLLCLPGVPLPHPVLACPALACPLPIHPLPDVVQAYHFITFRQCRTSSNSQAAAATNTARPLHLFNIQPAPDRPRSNPEPARLGARQLGNSTAELELVIPGQQLEVSRQPSAPPQSPATPAMSHPSAAQPPSTPSCPSSGFLLAQHTSPELACPGPAASDAAAVVSSQAWPLIEQPLGAADSIAQPSSAPPGAPINRPAAAR